MKPLATSNILFLSPIYELSYLGTRKAYTTDYVVLKTTTNFIPCHDHI